MKGTTHKGWKNKAKKQHSRGNAILHCISLCKQESALVCYGVLHVCCDRGVRRSYGETKGSFSLLSPTWIIRKGKRIRRIQRAKGVNISRLLQCGLGEREGGDYEPHPRRGNSTEDASWSRDGYRHEPQLAKYAFKALAGYLAGRTQGLKDGC